MTSDYTLARDVPLRGRTTFRVAAEARCLATVHSAAALPALLAEPVLQGGPLLVLGEGSNVLFATPRYEGTVVQFAGTTVTVLEESSSAATLLVEAAHGWDAFVDWSLARGLAGLENLALIPGQVGAAPIQNIGAYGVEVGEHIVAVHVHDLATGQPVRLTAGECGFGYRDSVFKREPDRRIVTAVEFRLARDATAATLDYAGLREELEAMGGLAPTPPNVAAAVRRIRRRKLPDPAVVGNAGSFFKNPIVPASLAAELAERHPGMPLYPTARDAERKLSAAWLIERAGWRGYRSGDAGISAQHALVLVNHGTASGAELLDVARRVADSVERQFGVRLEPEPRIVGATF